MTGYKQASKDLDAAVNVFVDKECEMADVQATRLPVHSHGWKPGVCGGMRRA